MHPNNTSYDGHVKSMCLLSTIIMDDEMLIGEVQRHKCLYDIGPMAQMPDVPWPTGSSLPGFHAGWILTAYIYRPISLVSSFLQTPPNGKYMEKMESSFITDVRHVFFFPGEEGQRPVSGQWRWLKVFILWRRLIPHATSDCVVGYKRRR